MCDSNAACDCSQDVRSVSTDDTTPTSKPLVCKKCRTAQPFIIMEKIHVHCRDCFVEACRKKFRATLGKSKMLTHGDRVLVAYSGGQSSTMLLDLIQHSLQCDQHKQLKFTPTIIYVDTGITLDEQPHVRAAKVQDILSKAAQRHVTWKFLWTTLETSFNVLRNTARCDEQPAFYDQYLPNRPVDDTHWLFANETKATHFKDLINSTCSDLTSKLDLVQKLLRKSIQAVAQYEFGGPQLAESTSGSKFIFTGSTSSQLATGLMIDVILGQGSELQASVGFSDSRHHIAALRPLREFSKKEVAFYLIARELELPWKKTLSTLSERKASIHRVTEAFLNKLYVDYPATYYTLLRIGNKMHSSSLP